MADPKVRSVQRFAVNAMALLLLENLADQCREGKLQGFVLLGVGPEGVIEAAGGTFEITDVLLAFEVWKHRQLHMKAGAPLPSDEPPEDPGGGAN